MSFGSNFTVSVEICQLRYNGDSWSDVPPQENQDIDFSFCVPFNDACVVKVKSILQFISFLPESCIFQYNLFFLRLLCGCSRRSSIMQCKEITNNFVTFLIIFN